MATMDDNANRSAVMFDQPFPAVSASQSTGSSQSPQRSGRSKRARASDAALDPAKQQEKREKARERQRRKRERDKRRHMADAALHLASFPGIQEAVAAAASSSSNPIPVHQQQQHHLPVQPQQQQHPPPPPPAVPQSFPPPPQPQEVQQAHTPHTHPPPSLPQPTVIPQNGVLTPEELNRRDRVRAAARERQRKHRALVKQKKMAELGLAMGNDGVGGMEEIHYALGPDGQYQPVPPPQQEMSAEQPFPQGHTGGQTFASTLLLSFSCSPLLKQHLLRSLHMTNEELASLEPILSAAWDQWDHAVSLRSYHIDFFADRGILSYKQRRIHYAEQAAKVNTEHQQQNGAGPSSSGTTPFVPPQQVDEQNDFRARFHRPLTAPSPFGNATNGAAPSPGQPQAQIDPTLGQQQSQAQGPANGLVNGLNGTASNTDSTADGEGEIDMEEKDEEDVAKGLEG